MWLKGVVHATSVSAVEVLGMSVSDVEVLLILVSDAEVLVDDAGMDLMEAKQKRMGHFHPRLQRCLFLAAYVGW
jgi:hypothetical protein